MRDYLHHVLKEGGHLLVQVNATVHSNLKYVDTDVDTDMDTDNSCYESVNRFVKTHSEQTCIKTCSSHSKSQVYPEQIYYIVYNICC